MFDKEIRFIHDICMNQIANLGSFVTFEELTGTDLHPSVLKYISAEIDLMILEDRQKLLEQSNFDYTGEEMTDAFRQIGQIIKSSKKFPIDYISNLILLAISFNINYLVRPRKTLIDFIFQKEEILNVSFVKHMLNYTYYYSYIRKVFEKYSVKKALLTIPRSDFETILAKLDLEMFESHTNRLMDTALNSIADFFNIGSLSKSKIPLTALEPFLLEKNLDNYLDRLKSAFPVVTKFTYNLPDIQRVMYSTTPIKRESYLDKAAQKKVQDSVLGIEEKVVNPNKEIEETTSKAEFQEAEFTLIQETDDQDTISRLRNKNVKTEHKDEEPRLEIKKAEEVKKEEKQDSPQHEYNLFDLRQEEIADAQELKERQPEDPKDKENLTEIKEEKNTPNKRDNPVDVGLLESEEADLMDMYDKEIGNRTTESIPEQEVNHQDNESITTNDLPQYVEIENEINNEVNTDILPEENKTIPAESTVEEVVMDTETEDDFIVIGEEGTGTAEIQNHIIPNEKGETVSDSEVMDDKINPDLSHDINIIKDKPAKHDKFENIRKRRIMVKKFKPFEKNSFNDLHNIADKSQDIAELNNSPKEESITLQENSENSSLGDEDQTETIKDIFSSFTEKELQRILKGVFNDDAEDFALTLDTIAACNNYDEAAKLLRSLFRSYKVKNKSKEAVILKKAISQFFSKSNDSDLI